MLKNDIWWSTMIIGHTKILFTFLSVPYRNIKYSKFTSNKCPQHFRDQPSWTSFKIFKIVHFFQNFQINLECSKISKCAETFDFFRGADWRCYNLISDKFVPFYFYEIFIFFNKDLPFCSCQLFKSIVFNYTYLFV